MTKKTKASVSIDGETIGTAKVVGTTIIVDEINEQATIEQKVVAEKYLEENLVKEPKTRRKPVGGKVKIEKSESKPKTPRNRIEDTAVKDDVAEEPKKPKRTPKAKKTAEKPDVEKMTEDEARKEAIQIGRKHITFVRTSLKDGKFAPQGKIFYIARWNNGTRTVTVLDKRKKPMYNRVVDNKCQHMFLVDLAAEAKFTRLEVENDIIAQIVKDGGLSNVVR